MILKFESLQNYGKMLNFASTSVRIRLVGIRVEEYRSVQKIRRVEGGGWRVVRSLTRQFQAGEFDEKEQDEYWFQNNVFW